MKTMGERSSGATLDIRSFVELRGGFGDRITALATGPEFRRTPNNAHREVRTVLILTALIDAASGESEDT